MIYTSKYIKFLFVTIGMFVLLAMNSISSFSQVPPPKPKVKPNLNVNLEEKEGEVKDTLEKDLVIIDHADIAIGIIGEGRQLFKEVRQVEMRQGETYMYCDSAFLYDNNNVRAWGNVIIQQGDSMNIFSDSLFYNGFEKKADFYGEVVLESTEQKLFTDRLNYDLTTKIASYFEGATLTNDTTHLTSKIGYYYVGDNMAFFKDSVVVVDPQFELKSDTLKFDTKEKITYFLGPTLISQNEGKIYCEDGFYDIKNKKAEFEKKAQYQKGEEKAWADLMTYDGNKKETTLTGKARFIDGPKQAKADVIRYEEGKEITNLEGNAFYKDENQEIRSEKIRYDKKNEEYSTKGRSKMSDPPQILVADRIDFDGNVGIAVGNVIWRDTTQDVSISHCDSVTYLKDEDFLKAMGGRPLMTIQMDEDSLFLASDTLISFKPNPEDSVRTLLAYPDVRLFKSDLQAVCDSLVYSEMDSIFKFYDDPIIWSDTSQFSADTIHIQLVEKKVNRIYLFRNSFMINSPDEVYFNQIKGKNNIVFFENDEVRRMKVNGNAESIYFAVDDDEKYIGSNKTVASSMLLYFGNNQVDNIKFYTQPKAKFTPMEKATDEEQKLDGFNWDTSRRPMTLEDLFFEPNKSKTKIQTALPPKGKLNLDSRSEENLNLNIKTIKQ